MTTHRVEVEWVDDPSRQLWPRYHAVCDPRPPGAFCWVGPDRLNIFEAVTDGQHHAGCEPEIDPAIFYSIIVED